MKLREALRVLGVLARRTITEIAKDFGEQVDFSQCDEADELKLRYDGIHGTWDDHTWHRESDDPLHIAVRARRFFDWLAAREEEETLVSTHSAFLWHLFNHGHQGYVQVSGAASRDSWWYPTAGVPGWACGHARQPRQTPLASGGPGIDVAFPLLPLGATP